MDRVGINGKTAVVGIFGEPVGHTLSPTMHNEAFAAMGLNFAYLPFRVINEELRSAVAGIRALGLVGVNITVPHKEAVIPYLDIVTEEARLIGAVNTIVNRGGVLTGYNTDATGFLRALQGIGFDPKGKESVVIGAGGAARAVGVALAMAGAGRIMIFNRTRDRAEVLAAQLAAATGVPVVVSAWGELGGSGISTVRAAEIVIQTTSVGMYPDNAGCPPVPGEAFRKGQLVVDLIYRPAETCFMQLAAAMGAVVYNGEAMLLHQGAVAFELWTGKPAPIEVMREAINRRSR